MNVRVIPGDSPAAEPPGSQPGNPPGRATADTTKRATGDSSKRATADATKRARADGLAPAAASEPVERRSVGDRLRLLVTSGEKAPLYPRLLRLRNVHPNGWQRAVLVEGMVLVGALAALADLATAWAPAVLPVAAGVVVKFHDVLAGLLRPASGNATAAPPARGDAAGTDERR